MDVQDLDVVRGHFGEVPFFATQTPSPFLAGITFRVGRADETAATLGLTHLIEHLVLPNASDLSVDYHNGTVDNLFTTIWGGGEPAAVRAYLERVQELLLELPFERLELERRILTAEQDSQSWSAVRQAFALRFGPVGQGLTGYLEYGLQRVDPDELARLARERFTSGNAAVWMTDPSFELSLSLPSGTSTPAPEPRPLPYVEYPCVYSSGPSGGVLLSMMLERSYAGAMGLQVLEHRLRDRLRYELGFSYDISVDRIPLTGTIAHAVVTADVSDENVERWCTEAVEVIDRLIAEGPTDDELESDRARKLREDTYHAYWSGLLEWMAGQHLLGEPFESRADSRRAREQVMPAAVSEALAAARSSLLVLGPEDTPLLEDFADYPLNSPDTIEGRRHRPKSLRDRLRKALREVELTSAPDGITLSYPNGSTVTARYRSTVLCIREPGTRTLLTDDGFFCPVTADDWTDGDEVLAAIDHAIPQEIVVSENPGLDARVDDVERLAKSTFKRTWHISEELETLPRLLADDERLFALAAGSRGWTWGLIVVTDKRLRFLSGDDGPKSYVVENDDLSEVRMDGSSLEFVAAGEQMRLTGIEPSGKAGELEQLLDEWSR